MSKHKYEEAANRHAMEFDNETDREWSKYSFLAGCNHVEKVNSEVVERTCEDAYKKWCNGETDGIKNIFWANDKFFKGGFSAGLAIGRRLGRDGVDTYVRRDEIIKELQVENRALREDLEWALNYSNGFWTETNTSMEKSEQIRNKHFKEEALKEQGGVE